MLRVGEHLSVNLFLNSLRCIGKIYTVPERLAHLGLTVNTGKPSLRFILGYHSLGKYQCITIGLVELLHYLTGLLDHGKLIFSHGNNRCVKCSYVSSL